MFVLAQPWAVSFAAGATASNVIGSGPGLFIATITFSELPGALVVANVILKDDLSERVLAVAQGTVVTETVVFALRGASSIRVTNTTGPVSINAIPWSRSGI